MIQALAFFILGVVSDALITLHYIAITRGRAVMASILTVLIGVRHLADRRHLAA